MMILDLLLPFGLAVAFCLWELAALHRHDRRARAEETRAQAEEQRP